MLLGTRAYCSQDVWRSEINLIELVMEWNTDLVYAIVLCRESGRASNDKTLAKQQFQLECFKSGVTLEE